LLPGLCARPFRKARLTGHTGMASHPEDATSRSAMETQGADSACSDQNALLYGSSAHISGRRKHQRPLRLSSTGEGVAATYANETAGVAEELCLPQVTIAIPILLLICDALPGISRSFWISRKCRFQLKTLSGACAGYGGVVCTYEVPGQCRIPRNSLGMPIRVMVLPRLKALWNTYIN